VDGADHTTYVAERHLRQADDRGQIEHPLLGRYFEAFDGTRYKPRHR
jgi:heat shock protein HspQ